MAHPYWPLLDLRVRTPRLELRIPTLDEMTELASLTRDIHDPSEMPFGIAWTDAPDVEAGAMRWYWRNLGAWEPGSWTFNGVVFHEGRPVGVQDVAGQNFRVLRTVETGSWLKRSLQGQGIGKEMRAAVLHLAFEGLGAQVAYSGAWHDNPRSLGVSEALGYERNGDRIAVRRDKADLQINLKLTRERWEQRRRDDIVIENLEPCLELFGVV